MQKITPFLWFDNNAEEAVNYYLTVFKNSRILKTTHYNDEAAAVSGRPKGSVMTAEFQIEGQNFVALNGGPEFQFSPATSFVVDCKTQAEVDEFWDKLAEGGVIHQCGWLTDKFGVTWQIVPASINEMLVDKDTTKSNRVMHAMLQMKKLEIAKLQEAYNGK